MNLLSSAMRHLAAIAALCVPVATYAGSGDYQLQLLQTAVAQGPEAVVAVRLMDKRTGASVPDAVIFATRLDMAPEGMEAMTTRVEPLPAREPGVYRFKTNLSMEGGWRLKLAMKVQGELETVQGELVLQATP
ncbi:FixH family protein [Neorhizobium sp. DAR64861/K0K2]|uniref:FixH family protein n=1 Tax=unclassified Neorhizobium TaxID=2629175 RepID=UPI003D2DB9C6